MSDPVILCLLLAMVTLALYWPATSFEFINYDDTDYFVKNSHIQNGLGWNGILWAFGSAEASNWHPLTWLSLMLDVSLFGSGGPAGPHFTNILFHAVNSVLLFWLLRRLTGAHWRSALVAGLFAVHPLNVESVAWVSERKNVLSTFFGLLTLLAYARYVQCVTSGTWQVTRTEAAGSSCVTRHSSLFYLLALLFFALGLMSKPMLVTLPFVLLLLDHWPLGRWRMDSFRDWRGRLPRLLLEKAPFFLLSAMACVLTLLVQRQGEAVQSAGLFPFSGRVGNMLVAYSRYLGKTFWPENLTVFYPHPGYWPLSATVPAAAFILAVCLIVVWQGRRFPFLVIGWLWFLGTLIPVIGLVQVGRQAMADRYTYVPLIGIFIVISWGAAEVFARWKFPKMIIAIMTGLVLTAYAFRTRDQLGYWQNDGTIFQRVLAVTPNNDYAECLARFKLGLYLHRTGRVDEAIANYHRVIQIEPDNLPAHVNLGNALDATGRLDAAAGEFRTAVRINPRSYMPHYNLGFELSCLGQRDEAIKELRQALRIKPDFAEAKQRLRELEASPPAAQP